MTNGLAVSRQLHFSILLLLLLLLVIISQNLYPPNQIPGYAPAVYMSSYFTRVAVVLSRLRLRSSTSDQLIVPSYNLASVSRRAFPVRLSFSRSVTLYISH